MVFETITSNNWLSYAMKHYDNPTLEKDVEFNDDLKRFKYLKRLFRKYETSKGKELKERLVINHIIILGNVFGVDAASTLLFFKIERNHWPLLKTFLVYLGYMPENDLVDVPIVHTVMGKLGQIK